MRKWMLAAGAAALAFGVPALADAQDRGGRGKSEQARQGGGDRDRARAVRQARQGGGEARRQARAVRVAQRDDDRPRARAQARARVQDDRRERRVETRAEIRAERREDRREARSDRQQRRAAVRERQEDRRVAARDRDDDRRVVVRDRDDRDTIILRTREGDRRIFARTRFFDDDDDRRRFVRRAFDRDNIRFRRLGLLAGCPPGLAWRDNGCRPPGHVRQLLRARLPVAFSNSLIPLSYRTWFRDDDDFFFRSGDGFIYRVDRDDGLIDGIIPLAGTGYYALGDPWPSPYNFYNVPYQYRSLYYDDDDDCYRYDGFGAIYRVDCDRGIVNGIVSLLAGDLGVGSRLPLGYDVYNVPMAYRSTYFDSPTAWYRYNDGYIYRVDPQTRLITAVIDALV